VKSRYATGYDKRTDYWLRLRSAIMSVHEQGKPLSTLDTLLAQVPGGKTENYADAISGYKRWAGKRGLQSAGQRHITWQHGGLTVNVNPELDLDIDDVHVLVKLYLNKEALSRTRLDLALHLLQVSVPSGAVGAILDVRRGKQHVAETKPDRAMDALLEAEADGLLKLWATL
jgi:hypothetical protein